MKKKLLAASLALAFGAGSGYVVNVLAQAKPDTLVKQRQAVMTLHGKYHNASLRPMAQGKRPWDPKIAARDIAFLDALSKMPWDGFTPETKDIQTRATPAVFNEPAKFKEAADLYQSEVAKLVSVSKGGDEAAIKAQVLAVDKACNSCHDGFRGK